MTRGYARWSMTGTALVATCLTVAAALHAGAGSSSDRRVLPGVSYRLDHVHGTRVHIVAIAPHARIVLGVAPAHGGIAGGLQTVRAIANRAEATIAVNGDFFLNGAPQGGVVSDQRLLRSPLCNSRDHRPQLSLRPLWQDDCGFGWTAQFRAGQRRLTVDDLNRDPGKHSFALFDQHWRRNTPRRHAFEVVLHLARGTHAGELGRALPLNWESRGHRKGGTPVDRRRVVVSAAGHDAAVLRGLWRQRERYPHPSIALHLTRASKQNVGCRPLLLSHGQPQRLPHDSFARGPHARTAVGWAPDGRRWIVTSDAGHGSRGWSLRQLTAYLQGLGATDACNLDGGGSTTMVVRGHVVNTPADGHQRPVANAVILTTAPPAPPQPQPKPSGPAPTPSGWPPLPIPTISPLLR